MTNYPHKLLTGTVSIAAQYLPFARSLLQEIRRLGLPIDARTMEPVPGVKVRVKGGTAIPEHIHIHAGGFDWLALILYAARTGVIAVFTDRYLYGAPAAVNAPWQRVTNFQSIVSAKKIRSAGNGVVYSVEADEGGLGDNLNHRIALNFKGLAPSYSPAYLQKREVTIGFIQYSIPTFCGFVDRGDGVRRRRFVVVQIMDDSEPVSPAGGYVHDTGTGQYWRYLSWTEGDTEMQVIVPPDPRSGQPNTIRLRYGPVAYLGNDTLVAWSIHEYGVEPNDDDEFNAWRSTDFGQNWVAIGNTDIVRTDGEIGNVGSIQLSGTRCFAFGNNAVAWQISTRLGPTRTYRALAGEGITVGGDGVGAPPETELFLATNFQPLVYDVGKALILIRDDNTTPPTFRFRRTEDYGATWADAADFPVDQYIGLVAGHHSRSWPFDYEPVLAELGGPIYLPLQREDGSIGIYQSVDQGGTWEDSGGTIYPESLRWYDDSFFNGVTTPTAIVNVAYNALSNPALPELDEVVNGA